jgi:hypothetical protein
LMTQAGGVKTPQVWNAPAKALLKLSSLLVELKMMLYTLCLYFLQSRAYFLSQEYRHPVSRFRVQSSQFTLNKYSGISYSFLYGHC